MELQTIGALVFICSNIVFVFITKYFGFKITFTKDNNNLAIGIPVLFGYLRTVFCLGSLFLCLKLFEIEGKTLYICVAFIFIWVIVSIFIESYVVQKLLGKNKSKIKSGILELLSK